MTKFNRKNFSEILSVINSNYSNMSEFAKFAKFDRSYISKYIHMKLDNPPSPKILGRIADASKGITTYEELMRVCGYIEIERTRIEEETLKKIKNMVKQQIPGYSLINIALQYINKLEGKGGDNIADIKK